MDQFYVTAAASAAGPDERAAAGKRVDIADEQVIGNCPEPVEQGG